MRRRPPGRVPFDTACPSLITSILYVSYSVAKKRNYGFLPMRHPVRHFPADPQRGGPATSVTIDDTASGSAGSGVGAYLRLHGGREDRRRPGAQHADGGNDRDAERLLDHDGTPQRTPGRPGAFGRQAWA